MTTGPIGDSNGATGLESRFGKSSKKSRERRDFYAKVYKEVADKQAVSSSTPNDPPMSLLTCEDRLLPPLTLPLLT